jgi:hypothetical protein
MKVVRHFRECGNTVCPRPAVVYRLQQEDARAWRGDACGLEVVARRGELRYPHHWSMTKMQAQRQAESPLAISLKEVAWLCEVFLVLVTTVAQHDEARIRPWSTGEGIVLAMDGVPPDNRHERLDMWRDGRSGRVFVAQTRLSRATVAIEPWMEAVLGLGRPMVGVISDQQASIC